MALNSGIDYLWLEGDSLNIINYILGIIKPSWTIANIIEEIIANLHRFKKFHVSHFYHEANLVADWFTNAIVSNMVVVMWERGLAFLVATIELIRNDQF